MKRSAYGLIWVVILQTAAATPFLVCDPYPAGLDQATMPVSFVLQGLSANPISTQATINQDGTVQLHYDLSQLANGTYSVTVAAVNVLGGVSPPSSPFQFTKGVPSPPTDLRIVP